MPCFWDGSERSSGHRHLVRSVMIGNWGLKINESAANRKRLMPEIVGTNALLSKVLAVSNANAPVFPLLIVLGNGVFLFGFDLPERRTHSIFVF